MALVISTTGRLPVSAAHHIGAVRRAVVALAAEMGFHANDLDDLAIVTGELATNLVRHHTVCGTIEARPVWDPPRNGIEIISADEGPGIADLAAAETDGFSTRGTCGGGLGAVGRLMDQCAISSALGTGTRIVCRKWRAAAPQSVPEPLSVSVRSHCHGGELRCGDQHFVHQAHGLLTAAVIDGVGHGSEACAAATAAERYIRDHCTRPLAEIIAGAHHACRRTRGAAMTIARVDVLKRTCTYAGVGNVNLRLATRQGCSSGVIMPGTLGVSLNTVRVFEELWLTDSMLLLYSDGVADRWTDEHCRAVTGQRVQSACETLFARYALPHDDATLLVAG